MLGWSVKRQLIYASVTMQTENTRMENLGGRDEPLEQQEQDVKKYELKLTAGGESTGVARA